jgi:hypothetical protein
VPKNNRRIENSELFLLTGFRACFFLPNLTGIPMTKNQAACQIHDLVSIRPD